MNRQKIIFLGCDGVLNSIMAGDKRYFNPECFHAFYTIVSSTRAKIVLSKSWREFADWENILRDWFGAIGISVVGNTSVTGTDDRVGEIRGYIERHQNEIENYLVLDDYDMRKDFPGHCICTCVEERIGMDSEWAEEAIHILEGNDSSDSGNDGQDSFIVKFSRRRDGRTYYYRHDGNLTARKESSMLMERETALKFAESVRKNHRDFTARAMPFSTRRRRSFVKRSLK